MQNHPHPAWKMRLMVNLSPVVGKSLSVNRNGSVSIYTHTEFDVFYMISVVKASDKNRFNKKIFFCLYKQSLF
jgi:hypothetical protein